MNYDEKLKGIETTQMWLMDESVKLIEESKSIKTPEQEEKFFKKLHELRGRNQNLKKDLNNLK
jgi:hypothetical protein